MTRKKRIFIFVGIVILLVVSIFLANKLVPTGKSVATQGSGTAQGGITQQVQTIPLSSEEQQKVVQTISSSDFFQDVPEKNPIALTFFSFENGQKIWRDGFLLGKGQFLTQGEPTIYLTLHSKYISEFNGNNLCDVIQRANKNGDLGFRSEYSTASLLIKYASMLKHRECFGF